ncbi:CHAT domain-containing protein [Nocardia sp. bgisy134]|uniref:CHAT domain-containing protein n=1 Tax=Nocardia sp. bgisy134 TaxID=3413789 RepID=UPI003D711AA4
MVHDERRKVQTWIDSCVAFRDDGILSPQAMADAQRLYSQALLPDGGVDAGVAITLGNFYWLRYLSLPSNEGQSELTQAHGWFTAIHPALPDQVPPSLRPLVGGSADVSDWLGALLEKATFQTFKSRATGYRGPLDNAIVLLEHFRNSISVDRPTARGRGLYCLGTAYGMRFAHTADRSDNEAAISAFRQGVELLPPELVEHGASISDLGIALRTQFGIDRQPEQLLEAVAVGRQAIEFLGLGHVEKARRHANLAQSLLVLFQSLDQQIGHLDDAVELLVEALALVPDNSVLQSEYLADLILVVQARYAYFDDTREVRRMVDLARQALTSIKGPGIAKRKADLARALTVCFECLCEQDDLDEAVSLLADAVNQTPPQHVHYVPITHLYVKTLTRRYAERHDHDDIETAIALCEKQIQLVPPHHTLRGTYLADLGTALGARYEHRGDHRDLNTAIDTWYEAANSTAVNHTEQGNCLEQLSNLLRKRYERSGDHADLHACVAAARTASQAPHAGAQTLNVLGVALTYRAQALRSIEDADEAVNTHHSAATQIGRGAAELPGSLSDLSLALMARFDLTGDRSDLDEAIDVLRTATASPAARNVRGARFFANLRLTLDRRFHVTGLRSDLDEAVEAMRTAVGLLPEQHSERASMISNLGVILSVRGDEFDSVTDIDESIRYQHQAQQLTPDNPTQSVKCMERLAGASLIRFRLLKKSEDLRAAVSWNRTVAQQTPHDHPWRSSRLSRLGLSVARLYEQTADRDLLGEALDAAEQAVAVSMDSAPDHAAYLQNLGHIQYLCYRAFDDRDIGRAALASWKRASAAPTAPMTVRSIAAGAAAEAAAALGDDAEALLNYRTLIQLLPQAASRGISRIDRERLLHAQTGAAREGAAYACAVGDFAGALELLEHGRGVLWSQLITDRTALDDLAAVHPEFAATIQHQRQLLDTMSEPTAGVDVNSTDDDRSRRPDVALAAARILDDTIAMVRTLPGFEDFLRPPAAEALTAGSREGAVVVINIAKRRCDALVIRDGQLSNIALDRINYSIVAAHVDQYMRCQAVLSDTTQPRRDRVTAADDLLSVLRWLWTAITEPILSALGHDSAKSAADAPRLWWCPTGPLSVLPLHAAGVEFDGRGGNSVMDRVVSSYIPTVTALTRAESASFPAADPRLLIVGMPNTPGCAPLPTIAEEIIRLQQLFPSDIRTTRQDAEATHDAVVSDMRTHNWVHFCCHGDHDFTRPSNGGLMMFDGIITIAELAKQRHHHGEFAFLCACFTHTGSHSVMDESITVATALSYIGWRHIIATTWAAYDRAAVKVAESVYQDIASSNAIAAELAPRALHSAVVKLRNSLPQAAPLWLPFIHVGP